MRDVRVVAGVENMSHRLPKIVYSNQLRILSSCNNDYQLLIRLNPLDIPMTRLHQGPFVFPGPRTGQTVLTALSFLISKRFINNKNDFLYVDTI